MHFKCLNCGSSLAPQTSFCGTCGQKASVHRVTMSHFFHEVFHAFTHTDKGIIHLIKELALRPGSTARYYLLGKRQSYFNPFTFFLILMGLFVISNNYFKRPVPPVRPDARVLQLTRSPEARQQYLVTLQRVNTASTIFRKNGNVIAMIAVPFISFFSWLFFRKRGFNYAEHLTANMMFVAFSNLVFTLIVFPLQALFEQGAAMGLVLFGGMLLQVVYFAWSYNGFMELRNAHQRIKSFSVSLLCILLWALFSMLAMAVYVYQSWDFYKFFLRMKG